jgi:hypothetical protein
LNVWTVPAVRANLPAYTDLYYERAIPRWYRPFSFDNLRIETDSCVCEWENRIGNISQNYRDYIERSTVLFGAFATKVKKYTIYKNI